MSAPTKLHAASLLLMVASGFAGLGYQIIWTQQCATWLGHETAALLAVVAAFFGGLSLGALLLGKRIEQSARPVRWYAACELSIALWSLLLLAVMPTFGAWLLRLTGVQPSPLWQWSVAFFGTFSLLLPATAAMGATLPAMERVCAQLRGQGRSVAPLYAANTCGAVLGVLTSAFWLVPTLGLAASSTLCAALNVGSGVAALALFPARVAVAPEPATRAKARGVLVRLALTGALGIGYEVLVVRVLSQVTESTVYTFAVLLAVYLVGSALGAAAYQRWLAGRRKPEPMTDALLVALATSCLFGTGSLWTAEWLKTVVGSGLGGGVPAALAAEAAPAIFAFVAPTLVMGALFSQLAERARVAGVSFGRALGVNTLGAASAPVLFGVLAAPALGPKLALLSIALGYLALGSGRARKAPRHWTAGVAAIALACFAPPLAFVDVPPGGHVVSYQEGMMAAVSVVEDAEGVARLRINNRAQEGSSATQRVDGRQAWLPLLLHPSPKHALFLGLGTGVTSATAATDESLQVDVVELLPEVIAASEHFADAVPAGAYARLNVIAADARRYVRASERRYDVIVADNYHPARSGSGSLYTVEHFQAVRERLAESGLFCQWLPLHQLDRETLRSIIRSFLSVYPRGWALIASNSLETPVLGLVARRAGERLQEAQILEGLPGRAQAALGLEDRFALFGSFVAGPDALRWLAGDAPANTDDRPLVAYRAPRVTYAPDSLARDRFIALLHELSIEPSDLFEPSPDAAWRARLAAYWTARDHYIEAGRDVRPLSRVEDMLAQVREPLLSVLRQSPDFRPAYDPLLAMATALGRSNASGARELLGELSRLQPARPEATRALATLAR